MTLVRQAAERIRDSAADQARAAGHASTGRGRADRRARARAGRHPHQARRGGSRLDRAGVLFEALSCVSYILMFRPIFCAR